MQRTLFGLLLIALAFSWRSGAGDEVDLGPIRTLAAEGRYDAALDRLDRVLSTGAGGADARLLEGVILTRQGKTGAAIEAFRKLAADHPELPEVHNNLAVLYAAESRFEEAREALARAIELQPAYDIAHENLGDIYAKLASLSWSRAHVLNPSNRGARDKAALIAQALGDESPAAGEPTAADGSRGESDDARCLAASGFRTEAEVAPAVAWLKTAGARAVARSRDEKKLLNYKVFLPPFPDREAALAAVSKIMQTGIRDVVAVSRGDLEHGVMLGVFSTRQAVDRRVEQLRARGYEPRAEPRFRHHKTYWIEARPPAADILDTAAFERAFAGHPLRRIPCS